MEIPKGSFPATRSALVNTFARRSRAGDGCPHPAMTEHVTRLCATAGESKMSMRLYRCLAIRKIWDIEVDPSISIDGYIQPKGSAYDKGFRLVLGKRASATRRLFTIAHEICHTFFYEVVPEIKFFPHPPDEEEERLCNFGAAELLMPSWEVLQLAPRFEPSLGALYQIAQHFGVSTEATLIRLRGLGLWDCTLSFWYRRTNGTFALDRIYGSRANWSWVEEPLERAWENGGAAEVSGRAALRRPSTAYRFGSTFVYFQARRVRDLVAVLWNSTPLGNDRSQFRLFPVFEGLGQQSIANSLGMKPKRNRRLAPQKRAGGTVASRLPATDLS